MEHHDSRDESGAEGGDGGRGGVLRVAELVPSVLFVGVVVGAVLYAMLGGMFGWPPVVWSRVCAVLGAMLATSIGIPVLVRSLSPRLSWIFAAGRRWLRRGARRRGD